MKRNTDVEAAIVAKYVVMSPVLNERARRLWAAAKKGYIGQGYGPYGGKHLMNRERGAHAATQAA